MKTSSRAWSHGSERLMKYFLMTEPVPWQSTEERYTNIWECHWILPLLDKYKSLCLTASSKWSMISQRSILLPRWRPTQQPHIYLKSMNIHKSWMKKGRKLFIHMLLRHFLPLSVLALTYTLLLLSSPHKLWHPMWMTGRSSSELSTTSGAPWNSLWISKPPIPISRNGEWTAPMEFILNARAKLEAPNHL